MTKSINRLLLLTLLGAITMTDVFAQMTTVLPNDGGTSGNGRSPSIAFRRIRTHYLITPTEMANSGFANGTVVGRIGWTYSLASAGGTGPLIIYMQNTSDVTNLKGTNWAAAIAGMPIVHNNALTTIPGGTATPNISFSGGAPFTYTGGGVYVAFDWGCFTGTTAATTTLCNFQGLGVGGVSSAQSGLACPGTPATTTANSSFRPETRLGPAQVANDLGISHIYTQGNVPVGYATNLVIRARIVNEGANPTLATTADMNITGANAFSSIGVTVPALAPGAATVISFSAYTPTAIGANNIAITIPADDVAGNNILNQAQTTSKDINSYRYAAPITGGVGFNGGTGDFLAKFTSANNFGNSDTINGFEVIFTSLNQPYNVGVWTDVAGSPGVNIYTSPSQMTIQDTVFISLPDVEVSGSYWVGIRQTGIVNVGFGYQTENPVRNTEFKYTSPTGGTLWTDFAPGANFRISATVQYKTPVPPSCALYLAPANGGSACQNGTTLTWGSGGGGPTGYRVYFGTNQALVQAEDPGTLVQNSAATSYPTGLLSPSTTYHWRVTAYNLNGDASGCTTLSRSFTTNVVSCYCASTAADGTFEYVTNVQSGTFSNPSGSNLYSNNTGLGVINNVNIGSTFNITVTINPTQVYDEDRIYVFADFNQDGDWGDLGELCGNVDVTIAGGNVYVVPCVVPGNALPGNTLLRLKFGDEVSTTAMNSDPCQAAFTFGEVEDYLLNITCGSAASANNPVCENGNLNLTSTYLGSGTPVSYSWTTTAANGFTSASPNPTISGVNPANDDGIYTVTITDNNSCVSSASVTVAVSPAPLPTASSNAPICEGFALNLSSNNAALGQGTGNSFSWTTTAANGFTSTSQSPSVSANATANDAGTYTVVITNSFLCSASANTVVVVNQNPSLNYGSVTGVSCVGLCDGSATATALGGTSPYLYDDGTNFSITGTFSGILCETGTFTVTDFNNCSAAILFNIGHISAAAPTAFVQMPIAGIPAFACPGNTASLSVATVAGATKYIWDGPTGTTFNGFPSPYENSTPTATVVFGLPNGSGYLISVQAANGCGSSLKRGLWVRGAVSVPAAVTPTSGLVTYCANTGPFTFTCPSVTGATSYLWTITGDATVSGTGTTGTVNYGPAWNGGTLCVSAQTPCYTSPAKCIALTTGINPAVMPVLTGVTTVCPGATQTYSANGGSGANPNGYSWTLPGFTSGSSTTSAINVTFNTGFSSANICVTASSVCGVVSAPRCKSVAIGTPATPASIGGPANGLCGQNATYTTPSIGGVTYNWTLPPGSTTGGSTSNSINATLPGNPFPSAPNNQVCVSASNACGTSALRCITVKGAPLTPGAITANPASWCANDAGIEFTANTSLLTGAYSLNWTWIPASAATLVSGQTTPVLTVDWNSGNAVVSITASNACGNTTKTYNATVTCRTGQFDNTLPATENSNNQFSIYPNPANDVINIEFEKTASQNIEVILMDLSGRTIASKSVSATEGFNHTALDVSKIAKGAYMISVKDGDTNKMVRVVIE